MELQIDRAHTTLYWGGPGLRGCTTDDHHVVQLGHDEEGEPAQHHLHMAAVVVWAPICFEKHHCGGRPGRQQLIKLHHVLRGRGGLRNGVLEADIR